MVENIILQGAPIQMPISCGKRFNFSGADIPLLTDKYLRIAQHSRVADCCWHLQAQSFLFPGPGGPMIYLSHDSFR
jgi:hypothetical protein